MNIIQLSEAQWFHLRSTLGRNDHGEVITKRNSFYAHPSSQSGQVCESLVTLRLMKSHGPDERMGGKTLYRASGKGKQLLADKYKGSTDE